MRARNALRLASAIALTALMIWWAGPANVWRAARGAQLRWIVAALALVVVDRALMAYRAVALLQPIPAPQRPRVRDIVRIFFVSTYLGTFLPGSVGGDAVRTYALNRLAVPVADAFASVFLDRLLGIVSLLVMALAGIAIARELARDPAVLVSLVATAAVCLVAAAVIFSRRAGVLSGSLAGWVPSHRVRRATSAVVAGLQRYAPEHRILALVLGSSIAVQVLRVLQAFCLGVSLGIPLPITAYFAFIPVILLVMLLPISINGLGTSQLAFAGLFGRAGVPHADAIALSILFLALGVAGNLPGGLIYALGARDRNGAR